MAITADTSAGKTSAKLRLDIMSHQIGAAIMASTAGAVRDYLGEYDMPPSWPAGSSQ